MLLLQMGWFTADNAANNGVAVRELKKLLCDPLFDATQRYIRYICLVIFLAKLSGVC
jgi:hypothetical protein